MRPVQPTRIYAFPTVDEAYSYEGYIANSNTGQPIVGGLTGVVAEASLDGAAYSATGVTFTETGTSGFFTLTVGATQMGATYGTLRITCTNTDAETWYLDFRTDDVRERAWGIPQSPEDSKQGDYCEETGLLIPASRLKMVDGSRVGEFWETGIDD